MMSAGINPVSCKNANFPIADDRNKIRGGRPFRVLGKPLGPKLPPWIESSLKYLEYFLIMFTLYKCSISEMLFSLQIQWVW